MQNSSCNLKKQDLFYLFAAIPHLHSFCITEFEDRHVNKSPRKFKPLSQRALKILQSKLSFEYELYDFAKQRLAKQYMSIEHLLDFTTPLPKPKGPKKELSAWDRFQIELKY